MIGLIFAAALLNDLVRVGPAPPFPKLNVDPMWQVGQINTDPDQTCSTTAAHPLCICGLDGLPACELPPQPRVPSLVDFGRRDFVAGYCAGMRRAIESRFRLDMQENRWHFSKQQWAEIQRPTTILDVQDDADFDVVCPGDDTAPHIQQPSAWTWERRRPAPEQERSKAAVQRAKAKRGILPTR